MTLYQSAAEEGESVVTELMGKVQNLTSTLKDLKAERDEVKDALSSLQQEYAL